MPPRGRQIGRGRHTGVQPVLGEGIALQGGQGEAPPAVEPRQAAGGTPLGVQDAPIRGGESESPAFLNQGGGASGGGQRRHPAFAGLCIGPRPVHSGVVHGR